MISKNDPKTTQITFSEIWVDNGWSLDVFKGVFETRKSSTFTIVVSGTARSTSSLNFSLTLKIQSVFTERSEQINLGIVPKYILNESQTSGHTNYG